jgi:hypothetical protein
MQKPKKTAGELIKSREKMAVVLDFVHETFDQGPFVIAIGVVLARFLAIFTRWNNRNGPTIKNKLNEVITVITPIRQHMVTRFIAQQRFCLSDVMPFTAGQDEVQRVPQGIHFDMDFGAEPTSTTPQRLGFLSSVFLTPLPRRDARARRCCPTSHFPCRDHPQTAPSCAPKYLYHTSARSAYTHYSKVRIHWATSAMVRRFSASIAPLPQTSGSHLLAQYSCQGKSGGMPAFSSIARQVIVLVS